MNMNIGTKVNLAHIKLNRSETSRVGKHFIGQNHSINNSSLDLLKQVNYYQHLDAIESLKFHKHCNQTLMNNDKVPIPFCPLYSLIK